MSEELLLITTRSTFTPGAEELFTQHGCKITKKKTINKAEITFPQGTTQQEIFPRTSMMKYKILLPDGWCLVEIYNHFNGISRLSEVPPEEVDKLQTQPLTPIAVLKAPH